MTQWRFSPDGDAMNPDWAHTADGDYVPKESYLTLDGDRVYKGRIIDPELLRADGLREIQATFDWL